MKPTHKVKLYELASALGKSGSHEALKKEANRNQRTQKVLPVALSKTEQQKLQRGLTYDAVKSQVSVWDDVVRSNRLAEKIYFPVQPQAVHLQSTTELTKTFKPKTPLELEIAAILQSSKHVLNDDKPLTAAEEETLRAMSLEEANERRHQLQKARALQSYAEAKAHRMKKIKSKAYHRLLKRDRLKKQEKEFEELKLKDPAAALEEIDRQRINERMSLKHRNTGKWAKYLSIRAKHDINARESLAEQIHINKKLTQKRKLEEDDDEDEESKNCEDEDEADVGKKSNEKLFENEDSPWLTVKKRARVEDNDKTKLGKVEDKSSEDYRKVYSETRDEVESKKKKIKVKPKAKDNEEKKAKKLLKKMIKEKNKEIKERNTDRKRIKKTEDEPEVENNDVFLMETATEELNSEDFTERNEAINKTNSENSDEKPRNQVDVIEIDFNKIKQKAVRPQVLKTVVPDMILAGDDDVGSDDCEDDDEQRMTLAEAFADDDVTREFKEDKNAKMLAHKPKDIDLFLPGWGTWAGTGLKLNKRRKNRFILKPPENITRKDAKLSHVIINEDSDKKISNLQVSELPHPFKRMKDFEKSISAPVGQMWNTESAFRRLISPRVITKLGTVVEPIDRDALSVKRNNPWKWKVGDNDAHNYFKQLRNSKHEDNK